MNQYRLEINLSFETKVEAEKLMDACEPVILQASASQHTELDEVLKEQIDKSFTDAHKCLEDAGKNRDTMLAYLDEANNQLAQLRKDKDKGQANVDTLKSELTRLFEEGMGFQQAVEKKIKETEGIIGDTVKKLNEFDENISRAKKLIESSDFIHEMMDIGHNIVSGGSVKLIWRDPSKKGEHWVPVKAWDFKRT